MRHLSRDEKREIAGRARTLQERLQGPPNEPGETPPFDPDVILEVWESQYPDRESFEDRLGVDGLDREDVRELVLATRWPESSPLPAWIHRLEPLLEFVQTSDRVGGLAEQRSSGPVAFEEILERIGCYAIENLDREKVPVDDIDPAVAWLIDELERVSSRVLYVEFKSYLNHYDPELLDADPSDFDELPTTYYDEFVDDLLDGGVQDLCLEYPVLARQWVLLTDQFVEMLSEFSRRLETDRDALNEQFGVEGPVTTVKPLADDRHAKGRVPLEVRFESDEVVYKPRSVTAGQAFYTVVEHVDSVQSTPSFEPPSFVARDGYGWMEKLDYAEMDDLAAVERYYERAGVLLCLTYALNFDDCQLENLFVSGEHPYLVDGETFLRPTPRPADSPLSTEPFAHINQSVFLTQLLPYLVGQPLRMDGGEGNEVTAGFGESSTPIEWGTHSRPRIARKNSDLMSVESSRPTFDRNTNTPTVDGRDQPPGEYVDSIVDGFEETYQSIEDLSVREDFFSEALPKRLIADAPVRLIYRPTPRYGELLMSLAGRDPLRDGVRFSVETEALASVYFDGSTEGSQHWELYEAECRALLRRDVPRFTTRPDSPELRHDGSPVDAKLSLEPGYQVAQERVGEFTEADLERQEWLVRRSFEQLEERQPPPAPKPVDRESLVETASELFEDAMECSFSVNDRKAWTSMTPRGTKLSFVPARESLYYGRSGIAITAAALAHVTGRQEHLDHLDDILAPLLERIESGKPFPLGGVSGVGSVAYALSVIDELVPERSYREPAVTAAGNVRGGQIESDDTYDITMGCAGTITGLLACHRRFGGEEILDRATECGEHLLDSRVSVGQNDRRVWRTIEDSVYAGFSHGSNGIAYALARLGTTTGDSRFVDAAREALEFESTLYDPERRNWPRSQRGETYQNRWCHGRSGMALGRIGIGRALDDDALLADAETALSAVASAEPSSLDLVCCGNLGRVEALLVGAEHGVADRKDAKRLAGRCLARRERDGALALQGHTTEITNPTWFNGVSGAAYTFLRLADPDALPSVLLFE